MPSETIHIISMDGGGIYGLATARMLRKLCERDPAFLAKSDIASYRFAGTSAGALNALLLAKEEDPRAGWTTTGATPWCSSRPTTGGRCTGASSASRRGSGAAATSNRSRSCSAPPPSTPSRTRSSSRCSTRSIAPSRPPPPSRRSTRRSASSRAMAGARA
ncbi:MAG: patatin-like phospholipase family protein [Myxococcales bacterium]|nr:patatin-like phospholipase family protein [Myxococcales bacterium]MCB9712700.1 patatin-like phospholipase family protein [Myxococcales bacterium]